MAAHGSIKARVPWESVDSISDLGLRSNGALSLLDTEDGAAEIGKCLQCPRPVCVNCLAGQQSKKGRRGKSVDGQFTIDGW